MQTGVCTHHTGAGGDHARSVTSMATSTGTGTSVGGNGGSGGSGATGTGGGSSTTQTNGARGPGNFTNIVWAALRLYIHKHDGIMPPEEYLEESFICCPWSCWWAGASHLCRRNAGCRGGRLLTIWGHSNSRRT
jgi:hypothetical protein